MYLAKYLKGTRDAVIILRPNQEEVVIVYDNAELNRNCTIDEAEDDEATAKLTLGHVASFAGCIILFTSKLQYLVTLSATEAECVSLSHSLRDMIPIIDMLDELRKHELFNCTYKVQVECSAFEDNFGAMELEMVPKIRPRKKYQYKVSSF